MTNFTKNKIYAHRGSLLEAPENSQAAFDLALEQNADGLECDVQVSKDGVPVLWHDMTLSELGLPGKKVCDLEWGELQLLNISHMGGLNNKPFVGLLSLEDFLCRYSHKTEVVFEIKEVTNDFTSNCANAVSRIVNIIQSTTLPERRDAYWISSFSSEIISFAHNLDSQFKYTFNIDEITGIHELSQIHQRMPFLSGVCLEKKVLNKELCDFARELNLTISSYACNSKEDVKLMLDNGVDIMISDCPGEVYTLLKAELPFQ